jgi:hypothetical protein
VGDLEMTMKNEPLTDRIERLIVIATTALVLSLATVVAVAMAVMLLRLIWA